MDKEEEERILQFLDETLHDDPVSEENNAADHNPYYTGSTVTIRTLTRTIYHLM